MKVKTYRKLSARITFKSSYERWKKLYEKHDDNGYDAHFKSLPKARNGNKKNCSSL